MPERSTIGDQLKEIESISTGMGDLCIFDRLGRRSVLDSARTRRTHGFPVNVCCRRSGTYESHELVRPCASEAGRGHPRQSATGGAAVQPSPVRGVNIPANLASQISRCILVHTFLQRATNLSLFFSSERELFGAG